MGQMWVLRERTHPRQGVHNTSSSWPSNRPGAGLVELKTLVSVHHKNLTSSPAGLLSLAGVLFYSKTKPPHGGLILYIYTITKQSERMLCLLLPSYVYFHAS